MAAKRAAVVSLLAAGAVACSAVGFLIGGWIAATREVAHTTSERDANAADALREQLASIVARIDAIMAAVERLNSTPRQGDAAPTSANESAVLHEFTAAARALSEQMERLPEVLVRAPVRAGMPVRDVTEDPRLSSQRRPALRDLRKTDWPQWSRSSMLWTYRQVYERFGLPDEVRPSGSRLEWHYVDDDGSRYVFVFLDGLVVGLQISIP